jgi:hypothetical protein
MCRCSLWSLESIAAEKPCCLCFYMRISVTQNDNASDTKLVKTGSMLIKVGMLVSLSYSHIPINTEHQNLIFSYIRYACSFSFVSLYTKWKTEATQSLSGQCFLNKIIRS